jgi:hypothetical protein
MKRLRLSILIGAIFVVSGCYALGITDHPLYYTLSRKAPQADYVCLRGSPSPPYVPPAQNPMVVYPNSNVFPPNEYGYRPGPPVSELEYNQAYSRYVAACY